MKKIKQIIREEVTQMLYEDYNIKEGDTVKVNMRVVKEYDSAPPYLRLVNNAIKDGGGKVKVLVIHKNGMVSIYGSLADKILGPPQVPIEAVTKIK